jgi:hypothetical protein
MSESYKALCNDFYVNMKLSLKMELPRTRETVLDLFERVRKQYPTMGHFRRYRDEYALESPQTEMPHRWAALRGNCIRCGTVNPTSMPEAYSLHHTLLEIAPSYLSISPLDVDYVELLYGFDMIAGGNHDSIVLDAFLQGSPMSALLDIPGATPIDFQPMVGVTLTRRGDTEIFFEVKTRPGHGHHPREVLDGSDPISVYLTLRKFGPVLEMGELNRLFTTLCEKGEELVQQRVIPGLLVPIREAIASGNA